jgi:hypothetical protein
VVEGHPWLECAAGKFQLSPGIYFSIPGGAQLSGEGRGWVASRVGFLGVFSLGGPLEPTGRLRYIDGCSDSLLVAPMVLGDPCLNFLCMPPGVDQTPHTHPSVRVGVITSGRGVCRTAPEPIDLVVGTVFVLHPGTLHSFHTEGEGLRIVVYHPDSDFGPTHQNHPMINRTHVEGVPILHRGVTAA